MKAQSDTDEDEDPTALLLNLDKDKISQYEESSKDTSKIPSIWFSKRLLVTLILFLSFVNSAVIRSNVNMAVVEMTSNKSIERGHFTITQPAEFQWDSTTVGVVLSIFSYGALLSFLGVFPNAIFGPSISCAVSIMVMGITTILHSSTLYLNFYLFLVCRFITGLFEAFFNVSTAEIFTRWIPKRERSTLVSFSFNGANVGFAIAYPVLGYIAYMYGWKTIFNFTGTFSIILSVIMLLFVKNRPSQDKCISREELTYISRETNFFVPSHMIIHPYKMILTSEPVWALLVGKFIQGWITSVLNVYFPVYVRDFTHATTDEIGLISSIPNIVYIFMFPIAGTLMDSWKSRSSVTMTEIHKVIIGFTLITSSFLLATIVLISDFIMSIAIFVVIEIFMSFVMLILELITVNIAPNDTSIVAGLSTFSAAVSSIVSRTIIGFMITDHTLRQWNNCFLLTASVLFLGAVFFIKYGSSEAQPWSLEVFSHTEHNLSERWLTKSTK